MMGPESLGADVLDAHERMVWSGRPDVDALCGHEIGGRSALSRLFEPGKPPGAGGMLALLIPIILVLMVAQSRLIGLPTREVLIGLGLLAAVMLVGASIRRRTARRWAESLEYMITDRRLLILEDNVITDAWLPDELPEPCNIVPRGPRHGDLLFERMSGRARLWSRAPDRSRIRPYGRGWVQYERSWKAFKALPDPEEVDRRIGEWVDRHRRAANVQPGALESPTTLPGAQQGPPTRRIENDSLGLSVDLPTDWTVRVRHRNRPSGRNVIEVPDWTDLEAAADWNTLQAETPTGPGLQIELVDSPVRTLDPEFLRGGFLFRLLGGRVLDFEEDLRRGAFTGFSLTRRIPTRDDLARRMIQRWVVLHDGTRQLVVTGEWHVDSPVLERSMAAAVASIRVDAAAI